MEELQYLLAKCRIGDMVSFDHLNNHIWCYAHIINICSSHIVASFTSTSNSYLAGLKVPLNSKYQIPDNNSDSNDKLHHSDDEVGNKDYNFKLPSCYDCQGNSKFRAWAKGVKRDPLRRARRVIRLLRSSDKHRNGFQKFIQDGNVHGWFTTKHSDGKRAVVVVPELQLLRDVKTRWDSVYMMLLRLRELRPVSWSQLL
jgi:hypothetical protein